MRDWIIDLASRLLTGDDLVEAQKLIASLGATGIEAAQAYLDLARLIGEAADPTAAMIALYEQPRDPAAMLCGLIILCFASVRQPLPSQREASRARATLSAVAADVYSSIGDDLGSVALDFAVRLVGETAQQISRNPANQIPVIDVETPISMPSSFLAWHLYGDTSRGAELAERNGGATPMLMPTRIEALGV